jgi:hypothetical protein
MKKVRYRCWDGKKIYYNFNLHQTERGIICGLDNGAMVFEKKDNLMQYTSLEDRDGTEAWEGDVRDYKGKLWILVNDGWQFRLERDMYHFSENDSVIVTEDVIWESILRGNKFQNPELFDNE